MVVEYTEACLVGSPRGDSHLFPENIFFGLVVPENKIFHVAWVLGLMAEWLV